MPPCEGRLESPSSRITSSASSPSVVLGVLALVSSQPLRRDVRPEPGAAEGLDVLGLRDLSARFSHLECPVNRTPRQPKCLADVRSAHSHCLHLLGGLNLRERHLGRTTDANAAISRRLDAGYRPLLHQRELELSDGGHDCQQQRSTGAVRRDGLREAAEANTSLAKLLDGSQQVLRRAAEAVEPPHDQGVTLTGVRQELVELRSLGGRAARLVDEDLGATSGFESEDLERGVLVLSGDARVPEKLSHV